MKDVISTAPGVYFCPTKAAADATLLTPIGGRTASGWYKRRTNEIVLYNMDGTPLVAVVLRRVPWLVACSYVPGTKRLRFTYGISEYEARRLGVDLEQADAVAASLVTALLPPERVKLAGGAV